MEGAAGHQIGWMNPAPSLHPIRVLDAYWVRQALRSVLAHNIETEKRLILCTLMFPFQTPGSKSQSTPGRR
jgi:hypothetical protein